MDDRFANGNPADDAGGLTGDRLTTGLDPTARGFYHGGDIAGIISKLDYLWNSGEVANNARFVQATQANMAGTGIATFSDRLRDAVRGASPFDDDPRIQGLGSGLRTDPNDSPANGSADEQRVRLLHYQDLIKVGLAGNLADYSFVDSSGATATGSQVDYKARPPGTPRIVRGDHLRRRARQRSPLRRAAGQVAASDLDGRTGANEHGVAGHHRLAPGSRALARGQRPAALEVVGPQLLQLRGLVQPDRLGRSGEHLRFGPAPKY
jgi:hypothetical protein